jgi:hypothetical protein
MSLILFHKFSSTFLCFLQAEKEIQKKQKAQSFQQGKAKGKVSKNAKRWN